MSPSKELLRLCTEPRLQHLHNKNSRNIDIVSLHHEPFLSCFFSSFFTHLPGLSSCVSHNLSLNINMVNIPEKVTEEKTTIKRIKTRNKLLFLLAQTQKESVTWRKDPNPTITVVVNGNSWSNLLKKIKIISKLVQCSMRTFSTHREGWSKLTKSIKNMMNKPTACLK